MSNQIDIEAALRASLVEQARQAPSGSTLAERLVSEFDEVPLSRQPRRRTQWRVWTLPLVAAGSVAAITAALVGITQLRHTADLRPPAIPLSGAPASTSSAPTHSPDRKPASTSSHPSSSPSSPGGGSGSPRIAPVARGAVMASLDVRCSTYGFDVRNTTALPHGLVLTVDGVANAPVTVAAESVVHVALSQSTPPSSHVVLTSDTTTVLFDGVVHSCDAVDKSVTIAAGTSYTLSGLLAGSTMAPAPAYGTVTVIDSNRAIRYTPDPCFSGTDQFGYQDTIASIQGVVTVTVQPGACQVSVWRSATDCAKRSVDFSASNPTSLSVTIEEAGQHGPSDTREFVVPAHTTQMIWQAYSDPAQPSTESYTFSLLDPLGTLFTDSVTFPCGS